MISYVEAPEFSVIGLANKVQTEADAYLFMEQIRWQGTPVCPHCNGTERISFLTPADGSTRKTRTGSKSERRVWFCGPCRKQFSVLTGTIFHGTKVSVRKWLFVFYEMCANKNGLAAREIERKYEVTAKTAWFMTQRIREAMKRDPFVSALRGTVVADETFIGGSVKNRHRQNAPRHEHGGGSQSTPKYAKTAVVSLISEATGEVRSAVVPNVTGATLRKAISQQVDVSQSILHTDAAMQYRDFGREFIDHQYVDHSADEYVRYEADGTFIGTNPAEGYFSQLKRSIDGTHHKVSVEHLPRYLAEFDFRYSTRKLSDDARTKRLFGQVAGRRLSYRPLIGD
jgi:transposase-like protein